jgi:hypothetical protein
MFLDSFEEMVGRVDGGNIGSYRKHKRCTRVPAVVCLLRFFSLYLFFLFIGLVRRQVAFDGIKLPKQFGFGNRIFYLSCVIRKILKKNY